MMINALQWNVSKEENINVCMSGDRPSHHKVLFTPILVHSPPANQIIDKTIRIIRIYHEH